MIEWDEPSYQRKYGLSWTKLRSLTTTLEVWYRVIEFALKDGFTIQKLDGSITTMSLSKVEPIYAYVPSQIIQGLVLQRKHTRSYTVGVGPNNYYLFRYSPTKEQWLHDNDFMSRHWAVVNPDNGYLPISKEAKEDALKNYGPISKRLYLGKGSIYYLSQQIGVRTGKDMRLFNKNGIEQEIYDALREVL